METRQREQTCVTVLISFIASNAFTWKEEILWVNYLYLHIKKQDKVEKVKPKVSRKNEIFKK